MRAQAVGTTYFVDGACPTSGTGLTLTCGSSGPFRTVNEGIQAMSAPGDVLNIRGAHDGFDGRYFEEVWMAPSSSRPAGIPFGDIVDCRSGTRCVIQGCPAGVCSAGQERPVITGATLRGDWTDRGGGVYSRVMEAAIHGAFSGMASQRPAPDTEYDPYVLVEQGQPMGYAGDNVSAPGDGRWSFHLATNEIYANPTGSALPGSTVYVPHYPYTFVGIGPGGNYTIQHMDIEHGRWETVDIGDPGLGALPDIIVDDVSIRYSPRFCWHSHTTANIIVRNSLIEYCGRGGSYASSNSGGWGMRIFVLTNGLIENTTVRHMGNNGTFNSDGVSPPQNCSWCDAPWNDPTWSVNSKNAIGIQIKQTNGFTIRNVLIEDVSSGAISIDTSRNGLIENSVFRRVEHGVSASNFEYITNPSQCSDNNWCYSADNVIRNNVFEDCGGSGDLINACISIAGTDRTQRHTGSQFLVRVYNNFFRRVGVAMFHLRAQNNTPDYPLTMPTDVLVANNSVDGSFVTADVTRGTRGTVLADINPAIPGNTVVVNNICHGVTQECTVIGTNANNAGLSYNYNLYGTDGLDARWNATVPNANAAPSGGTTGTASALQAATPFEDNFRTGNPLYISSSDQHLMAGSLAIETGQTRSEFSNDFDGNARPQGVAWDIGADEFVSAPPPPPPPPSDTTPPNISSILTSSITTDSAMVSWTTDEQADTQVDYGLTTSYGLQTTLDTSLVTSHSQPLSGLIASTLYHYRVRSRDAAGNLALSSDQTFTTSSSVPPPPTPPPGPSCTPRGFISGAGQSFIYHDGRNIYNLM